MSLETANAFLQQPTLPPPLPDCGDEAPAERPPFPYDAFHGPFADFAKAIAESLPVPPELPYVGALAIAGALAGKGLVAFNPVSRFTTPPNLGVIVSAVTGSGKGLVVKSLAPPLLALQGEVVTRWHEEAAKLRAERKQLESPPTPVQKRRKGEQSSTSADIEAYADGCDKVLDQVRLAEIERILELKVPQWIDAEPTMEGLRESMANWGECAFILNAEAEGLLQIAGGRYSDGQANFGSLCSLYSGDPVSGRRTMRRTTALSAPCLSMFLAVQPDLANKLRASDEARSRGLLGRLLWLSPSRERAVDPDKDDPAIPPAVCDGYGSACRAMFDRYCRPGKSARNPAQVRIAEDAARHLRRMQSDEQKRRWAGESDAEVSVREVEQVTKIALCLHLMRHGCSAEGIEIPLTTVQDASRLYAALLAPWAGLAKDAQDEKDEQALKLIAACCKKQDVPGLTARDLAKVCGWHRDESGRRMRDAFIRRMTNAGRLKEQPKGTEEKSARYAVV